MNNFQSLYNKAFKIAPSRDLILEYSSCGGVGSALITKDGNVYTGICLDFCCSLGFCAEHAAIAEMLKNGESEITEIIAVGENGKVCPPCGRCREIMMQVDFNNCNTIVHLSENENKKLEDLLPNHWISK